MNFEKQEKLSLDFFDRRGSEVARDLIGKLLVNEENGAAGLIVETEAYLGSEDPSCHYDGRSTRRGAVFERGSGTVYVYKIHGHDCMNFIAGSEDYPEGVLIRALRPVEEVGKMRERRGFKDIKKLCSGPGKLTEALGISKKEHNGEGLELSSLSVYDTDLSPEIETGSRVGISSAEDWPMRYAAKDSGFISKKLRQPQCGFNQEEFYRRVDK